MLDGSAQQTVIGVLLVTFAIVEGVLVPFVNHYRDFTSQCISESSKLTQICT